MPIVVVVFVAVTAAALALKRSVVWVFKKVSGQDKIEASQREMMRHRYENPDWGSYEGYLGKSVPRSMKLVWESTRLRESPIVRLGDEEYFLYPICSDGLAEAGFYPLGQNELGAAIFLTANSSGESHSVFVFERRDERALLHPNAEEFFEQIAKENGMIV
ncbi:MAG: hypothetical protein QNJ23_05425 [Woeseiaceae bacterium]|nr:hypothetical protein [Woeseiaceae bacterium]